MCHPVFRIVLGFAALASASLAAERDLHWEFPVDPGCTLQVDSHRGSIYITDTDEPRIRVAVHLEIGADRETEVGRMLAGLQLEVKAPGNTVSIVARNPAETRLRWIWE